ncbi:hypothetical protein K504DRAFT_476484 [Pleomassaria siparia CBS 279.74]|uniref:Prolyl 4-hydroxylase alpha subunit domain-containing protein n=1 Tax=Pleomassaria siparia CBS 279.74 TaxID=1314801 RepID=A0A6G1KDJ2_9PLEO|nr:hypothetical protein K504DRAFT_476484 [Pleomassaria siparia CBS 279.74]
MAVSLTTFVQYIVFGLFAYILAGAPSFSLLSSSDHGSITGGNNRFSGDLAESLVFPEKNLSCVEHGYKVHLLSTEPLIVYIEEFLTGEEAEHVVQMSESSFQPSTVWTSGVERLDPLVRHSEKAKLDRDRTVKCIEERARVFQGWRPNVFIERLWSQKYAVGGHYTYHYDWSSSKSTSGRISSFMVYLESECTGGGTNFPRVQRPKGEDWCRFIECEEKGNGGRSGNASDTLEGVTFKPIKGNAVFWENMRSDGSGYKESWHAGLPVKSGRKIGLNIWSWYQEGYVPLPTET